MTWTSRLMALRTCVQSYENYLEDRVNELLATEPVTWGTLELRIRVRRPRVDTPPDGETLRRLHGLLGVRCGRQVAEARAFVSEFDRVSSAESEEAEDMRATQARLQEVGLDRQGLEASFMALERAVERTEGNLKPADS